jgi:hypothetical protein
LPSYSYLAADDQLSALEAWRESLQIPANSAFLDGTLLLTVEALLGSNGPAVLTPVTLWELTVFIDALVSFDRLYCIANPIIDVSHFNQRLGADVLTAIPDPDGGVLRRLAAHAAANAFSEMESLTFRAEVDDAWRQEVQAVIDGWRAVLGPDLQSGDPFSGQGIDKRLAYMDGDSGSYSGGDPDPWSLEDLDEVQSDLSANLIDGAAASGEGGINSRHGQLRVLIEATRLSATPGDPSEPPAHEARQQFAAFSTYRTYVNQAVANALALPYLPGTLRMPFRRLFVERAAHVQDELVTLAVANRNFAQLQPSSPLTLPFFTAAVLQGAHTRDGIWAEMARAHDLSDKFRRVRADLDRSLERSEVSPEALRIQRALREEALRLGDVAGATQQAASVALGVLAQIGIVPLAGALQTGVNAARGLNSKGSWRRIWRRLFHRHEYFLAQMNSQAIALTNALPQVQELWEMPKIGGYLNRFATATQQIGHSRRH